jgi:hypothetical protein
MPEIFAFRLWFMQYDTLGINVVDQLTVLTFTVEVKLKAAGLSKALIANYTSFMFC